MRVAYRGLTRERLPSGNYRYRVRVEGNPRRRIRLHVAPEDKDFLEHYHAARAGVEMDPERKAVDNTIRGSVAWLTFQHLEYLEGRVRAGLYSPLTLKKRHMLFRQLREACGEFSMEIPTSEIIKLRDSLSSTPAYADSLIAALRVMYSWAMERELCASNPALGVGRIDRGKGGATPWRLEDLKVFRRVHRPGSMAHLCLTLLMFTACRIGDAAILGPGHEFERDGVRGLGWRPRKKGSAYVEIPILPPLYKATRALGHGGATYLLTDKGVPFKSPDALGQRFRKWCHFAGLEGLSAHGIRKAAGHLLAQEGCTQYQIMAIHGHTMAQTSEVYTKGVERWRLASEALRNLEGMEW